MTYISNITGKQYKSAAIMRQAENRHIWYAVHGKLSGYNKEAGEKLRREWENPTGPPPPKPPPVPDFVIPYEVFAEDWKIYREEHNNRSDKLLQFLLECDFSPTLSEIAAADKEIIVFFTPILEREYDIIYWSNEDE